MAQRSAAPLRVTVPSRYPAAALISTSPLTSKFKFPFSPALTPTPNPRLRPNETPAWIVTILQLIPLYMLNRWLNASAVSPSLAPFVFVALFSSAAGVWFFQQPWKGRPLTSQQWGFLLAHGGVLALSTMLRFEGLRFCGPLTTVLGEYAGAVVGKWLLNSIMKGSGRSGVRGLMAIMTGIFLLSQGWAIDSCFPLSIKDKSRLGFLSSKIRNYGSESEGSNSDAWVEEKNCVRMLHILAPIMAGLLLSLYKASVLRTSLKSVPKKRLQTLSITLAAFLSFPLTVLQWDNQVMLDSSAFWPLCSMVGLGMLQVLYGDSYLEEKLTVSPLSSKHYLITACGICLLELWYGLDISLIGFVFCTFLLGVGVRELTFSVGGISWESIADQESAYMFATLVKSPFHHLMKDRKSRKIALFLLINTSFMVVEFIFGFLSNSLGLISDACHMLFDCAALAIGLYASYISRLPANEKFNYGYGRFEVLSGYANAVFLILVASLIVLESLERILDPPEISTESLLVVSVGGLLVNMIGLVFFHDEHHHAHGSDSCSHSHSNDQAHKHDQSHAEHTHDHAHGCKSGHSNLHKHKHDDGHSHEHHHEFEFHSHRNEQMHNCDHSNTGEQMHDHANGCESGHSHHHEHKQDAGHSHDHHHGHELESHCHRNDKCDQSHTEHTHDHAHSHHTEHKHDAGHSHEHHHDREFEFHSHDENSCNSHIHGEEPESYQTPHDKHQHDHMGSFKLHVPFHFHDHSSKLDNIHNHEHQSERLSPRGPIRGEAVFGNGNIGHSSVDNSRGKTTSTGTSAATQHRDNKLHCSSHNHHAPVNSWTNVNGTHSPQLRISTANCEQSEQVVVYPISDKHLVSQISSQQISSTNNEDEINGHKCQHQHVASQKDHVTSHSDHAFCSHPHTDAHHYDDKDHPHCGIKEQVKVHTQELHRSHGGLHVHCEHLHSDHSIDSKVQCEHGDHIIKPSYQDESVPVKIKSVDLSDCLHHLHDDHDDHHETSHRDHAHIDHNMEGIFLHVLADTLGSVGVVISTILIKYKGWLLTDPACSIFISLLIISSVIPLVRNSAEILLQRSPRSYEGTLKRILKKLDKIQGVTGFHRLHIWSFTNKEVVSSLQIHATSGVNKVSLRREVLHLFEDAGITDITVQIEDT
ncbi:hypothetical protein O6H91_18G021200 [Diphasiastrum complanatum]|uniref:Uncharacterized protein n=2 Tax=Diphasiastrum complanatum TaxID=34168 RepID=A0ACC2AYQ5_DIPCM|nr:hypothetical protein O6H91_18G021200 [Diphasiastrum complanatum]KAJ7522652.1 hypothetical protein O6H91_18G021200 [Diphasiastrum complanatum]